jgi:two-component system, sensor histidine kinase and response regulator
MDINMPVMDGVTATGLLRQIEELCEVVIVAFSARTSGDNRRRALAAGCETFVNKTQGIGEVAATVRRFPPAA